MITQGSLRYFSLVRLGFSCSFPSSVLENQQCHKTFVAFTCQALGPGYKDEQGVMPQAHSSVINGVGGSGGEVATEV